MGDTHYDTLGVARNAAPEMIKKAYVALVKEFHPDHAGSSEEKQQEYNERLLEIMAAYDVLGNADRKAAYDADLAGAPSAPSPRGKKMSGMPTKSGDIETDYPVSMSIAAYGKGRIPMNVAGEKVVIKVYPGVRRYRIENKGVPVEGKPRGDLYVNLKVIPEENWEIDDTTNNLICHLQISPKVAENGGTLPLTLLFKKTIKITVPAGVKTGDRFAPPEGKGLGILSPKKKGNIIIDVEVAKKKGLFGLFG
ncbi:MAG: DnaJ domain-containing protein [Methanocorpusculum sp.]|jgi:DnaJ-class molecular chaperone|nr:DnaJ domain-containing protein [Methanocorpusculum sp.]MDD3257269.1 DnaJ C-terminal domain-containing protein [Methanocorpusculum sp.]MDD4133118.1 DnaJ C-terminal domain-containing protein [Methanocorpusculum sp.]